MEEYKNNENKNNKFLDESSLDDIQLIKDLEKKIYPIKRENRLKRNNKKTKNIFNSINEYNSIVKPINNFTFSTIEPILINISLKKNQKKTQIKKFNYLTQQINKNNSIINLKFKEKYDDILSQIKPKQSFMKGNYFDNISLKNTKSESLISINTSYKKLNNLNNFNFKIPSKKTSKIIIKENNYKLKKELFKKYLNV